MTRSMLTALVLALALPATAHATDPGGNGRIAYVAGNAVWVMNTDGSGKHRLTTNASQPAWSPDGTRIAFVRNRDVWLMDADGSDALRVTTAATTETQPQWSPDGSRIVFSSDRAQPRFGWSSLYTLRSSRPFGAAVQITPTEELSADEFSSWAADGVIAFGHNPDTESPIGSCCEIEILSGGVRRDVTFCDACRGVDWAPGADLLVFAAGRRSPGDVFTVTSRLLVTIRPGGGGRTALTRPGGQRNYFDQDPAWSPDGRWIAFDEYFSSPSRSPGPLGIWKMRRDGTERVLLAGNGADPAWQPLP